MANEEEYSDRLITRKILKMDKNNQYGYAMAKPLPNSCIKLPKHVPSWKNLTCLQKKLTWMI